MFFLMFLPCFFPFNFLRSLSELDLTLNLNIAGAFKFCKVCQEGHEFCIVTGHGLHEEGRLSSGRQARFCVGANLLWSAIHLQNMSHVWLLVWGMKVCWQSFGSARGWTALKWTHHFDSVNREQIGTWQALPPHLITKVRLHKAILHCNLSTYVLEGLIPKSKCPALHEKAGPVVCDIMIKQANFELDTGVTGGLTIALQLCKACWRPCLVRFWTKTWEVFLKPGGAQPCSRKANAAGGAQQCSTASAFAEKDAKTRSNVNGTSSAGTKRRISGLLMLTQVHVAFLLSHVLIRKLFDKLSGEDKQAEERLCDWKWYWWMWRQIRRNKSDKKSKHSGRGKAETFCNYFEDKKHVKTTSHHITSFYASVKIWKRKKIKSRPDQDKLIHTFQPNLGNVYPDNCLCLNSSLCFQVCCALVWGRCWFRSLFTWRFSRMRR